MSALPAPDFNPWDKDENDPWQSSYDSPSLPKAGQAISHDDSWGRANPSANAYAAPWNADVKPLQARAVSADPWADAEAVLSNESVPQRSRGVSSSPEVVETVHKQESDPDPWAQLDRLQIAPKSAQESTELNERSLPSRSEVNASEVDPWDLFEAAQSVRSPVAPPEPIPAEEHAWPYIPPTIISPQTASKPATLRKKPKSYRFPRDENVLFDAENLTDTDQSSYDEGEDDFGDFQDTSAAARYAYDADEEQPEMLATSKGMPSLLDPDDFEAISSELKASHAPSKIVNGSSQRFGAFSDMEDLMPAADLSFVTSPSVASATKGHHSLDPFDQLDFLDKPSRPTIAQTEHLQSPPAVWESWDDQATPTEASITGGQIVAQKSSSLDLPVLLNKQTPNHPRTPPSNVPPPALLLSLFPPIMALVKVNLFDSLTDAKLDHDLRISRLSGPATETFLTDYLHVAMVLARIIAGRKYRWKRDTLLSQSMRIGQAGSGGGMKLAIVDKTESVREERDVANVVRLWKAQAGKLRSTLTAAGIHQSIPDVAEVMPVRIAQSGEGALSALKPCVICALRRNERVAKIDVDVQDSFGEWWIEHWGHFDCKAFWDTHEKSLRGR